MLYTLLASLLLIAAVILMLDLNPERITEDIMRAVSPKQTLRDKVKTAQGKKRSRKLSAELTHIKTALEATGKSGKFTLICTLSLTLLILGCMLAILMNNLFLIPILSTAFAMIPFLYAKNAIGYYDRHIRDEMETALSIITTSYIRNDDLISAVLENIHYLKPPIRDIFKTFLGEAMAIRSDMKASLVNLREKLDNAIFREWVDTVIQCQDDRTFKDTLLPVVNKLTDIRIVNNELKTMLYQQKKEYWIMVFLLIGNIPLLYMLNKDWFDTLMCSFSGKIVIAVCGVMILITARMMSRYTKPIEYKR